jgi:outer membrane biosynthesis protein TonB
MILNPFWRSDSSKSVKLLAFGASSLIHLGLILILFLSNVKKSTATDFVKVDLVGDNKDSIQKSSSASVSKAKKLKVKTLVTPSSVTPTLEDSSRNSSPKGNDSVSSKLEESYQIEQFLGNADAANDPRTMYFTKIFRQISRFKSYPSLARQLSIEGLVKIKLIISTTGEVLDLEALYFDHDILKQASMDAIRKAGNFDRPPFEIQGSQFALIVPMRYQLNF